MIKAARQGSFFCVLRKLYLIKSNPSAKKLKTQLKKFKKIIPASRQNIIFALFLNNFKKLKNEKDYIFCCDVGSDNCGGTS